MKHRIKHATWNSAIREKSSNDSNNSQQNRKNPQERCLIFVAVTHKTFVALFWLVVESSAGFLLYWFEIHLKIKEVKLVVVSN